MYKSLVALTMVGLLVWAVWPTKVGYSGFQKVVQFFVNRLDPNYSELETSEKIDAMNRDQSLCYKNNDCVLVFCGQRPNASSFSVNKQARLNLTNICALEQHPYWDGYVRCNTGVCEWTRLVGKID